MSPPDARPVVAITGGRGYVGGVIGDGLAAVASVAPLGRTGVPGRRLALEDGVGAMADTLGGLGAGVLVHAAWDMAAATLPEMEQGSVQGTARLIDAARIAGVNRIVFISTISAFDGAVSAYGRAKLQAERRVRAAGGVVLRLGLVHGPRSGGVFGAIRDSVRRSRLVPLIGDGAAPQYLLPEAALVEVVRRAVCGDFDGETGPITVADPRPVAFRRLVERIAQAEGRAVTPVPVPWPLLFAGLWSAERLGLRLGVRSDSVISFVRQDPAPDFTPLHRLGLDAVVREVGIQESGAA